MVVDFEAIRIPDDLPCIVRDRARELLGHLKHNAGFLDDAIEAAAEWPPSVPGRGSRAMMHVAIILDDLRCLEELKSVLPPDFVSLWVRETTDRLQELGVTQPVDAPPEPPAPQPIREVRPFSLRAPSFEPSNDAAIYDYLEDLLARANDLLMNGFFREGAFRRGAPTNADIGALTQLLHDEACIWLETGRVERRLGCFRDLPSLLRHRFAVREHLIAAGVDVSTEALPDCDASEWQSYAQLSRAWHVNTVIIAATSVAPDRVSHLNVGDVTRAVRGQPLGWERLRAAYTDEDGRSPSESPHTAKAMALPAEVRVLLTSRECSIALLYIQGKTQGEIGGLLDIDATSVGKRIGEIRVKLRDTDWAELLPRRREPREANSGR